MVQAVATPGWRSDVVQLPQVSLYDFEKPSWGMTRRQYWQRTSAYLTYLREERVGRLKESGLNEPKAYQLLEDNIARLLDGQPVVWAPDQLGFAKALELSAKRFLPSRDRWFVDERGDKIPTRASDSSLFWMGCVTDGNYLSDTTYLSNIITGSFGIFFPVLYREDLDPGLQERRSPVLTSFLRMVKDNDPQVREHPYLQCWFYQFFPLFKKQGKGDKPLPLDVQVRWYEKNEVKHMVVDVPEAEVAKRRHWETILEFNKLDHLFSSPWRTQPWIAAEVKAAFSSISDTS